MGNELSCTSEKRGGGGTGGGGGESERTPVNIVNKGSFRYTGFQYTSLLPTDRLNVRLRATEIRFA